MAEDEDRALVLRGGLLAAGITALLMVIVAVPFFIYFFCRIEVPARHIAVLVRKTGRDLENGQELAPSLDYKGVQREPLTEGRYFRNPWLMSWEVVPQIEIPESQMGVVVRLFGDDLPYGEIIAWNEEQKGIVPETLRPGRYAYNAWVIGSSRRARDNYAYHIELHQPVTIPAGYKGPSGFSVGR